MKIAAIFTHEIHEGPGMLGDVLHDKGIEQKIIYTPSEDITDFDPLAPDLLIVMGGPMGVYEAYDYLFLNAEIHILQARLKADKPTLGICLGAQLMAAALGSDVIKGTAGQEIGWYDLNVNAAGLKTPARHLEGMMFHWHGDTFEVPPGATLLGSTHKYKSQIFSHGKNGLALQCHPEVMADQLEDWYISLEIKEAERVRADTERYIKDLNKKCRVFFEEWLGSVGL